MVLVLTENVVVYYMCVLIRNACMFILIKILSKYEINPDKFRNR